jgi:hypothetical protein
MAGSNLKIVPGQAMSKDTAEREGQQQESDSKRGLGPGAGFYAGSLKLRPKYSDPPESMSLEKFDLQLRISNSQK